MPRTISRVEVEGASPHNLRVPRPQQALARRCTKSEAKWPHYQSVLALPRQRPHPSRMTQPASSASVPREIPQAFFAEIANPSLPRTHAPSGVSPQGSAPMRALMLYDAIIDDIFANPATTLSATAARLGKAVGTISLVVRSDFFRARWGQRRDQYNEDLNFRLTAKIAQVAEKSLEVTLKKLEDRGTSIPLPDLTEANKSLLDRLGYAPSGGGGGLSVVLNNNNSLAAASSTQASPEGLDKARAYLRILEGRNAASGASPGPSARVAEREAFGPVVEGEVNRV